MNTFFCYELQTIIEVADSRFWQAKASRLVLSVILISTLEQLNHHYYLQHTEPLSQKYFERSRDWRKEKNAILIFPSPLPCVIPHRNLWPSHSLVKSTSVIIYKNLIGCVERNNHERGMGRPLGLAVELAGREIPDVSATTNPRAPTKMRTRAPTMHTPNSAWAADLAADVVPSRSTDTDNHKAPAIKPRTYVRTYKHMHT